MLLLCSWLAQGSWRKKIKLSSLRGRTQVNSTGTLQTTTERREPKLLFFTLYILELQNNKLNSYSLEAVTNMWKSRDLAVVIILAVASFVYTFIIGQLPNLFTGVLGLNYIFYFGHAIFISFGFLMYEGRRWRFLLQTVLVSLLTLPTYMSGAPFDFLARSPMIIGAFFTDLIVNSFYARFRNHNILIWWGTISVIIFLLIIPFSMASTMFLFYAREVFELYVYVYLLMLPVTLIETFFGSMIGYRIYTRVKKP